jgi:hypothetical protein
MIANHLQTPPIPPSQRTERPVPAELERLILKCLAKSPNDRPQSAGHLLRTLDLIPADRWGEDEAAQWWTTRRAAEPPAVTSFSNYPASVENTAPAF